MINERIKLNEKECLCDICGKVIHLGKPVVIIYRYPGSGLSHQKQLPSDVIVKCLLCTKFASVVSLLEGEKDDSI